MFRRLHEPLTSVTVYWNDQPLSVAAGDTVAAALLAAGVSAFGSGSPHEAAHGPYCMIGQCYGCLVEINGMPYRQACLTMVVDGMHIHRMVIE